MKKQSGFSVIEVMIASALLIALAVAAQQLLTSTTKSTGDLERRLRFRDLVDDLRFQFMTPGLCSAALGTTPLTEGASLSLRLDRGTTVAENTVLPEYGLKVTKLYLKNVQSYPATRRNLLRSSGELVGEYHESVVTADLYVEAQITGSGHALKPMSVVRIAALRRSGVINEEYCFGNHEGAGRTLAGGNVGAGGYAAGSAASDERSSFFDADVAAPPSRPAPPPRDHGTYVPREECAIEDPREKLATGRLRLLEGETVRYTVGGRTTQLRCRSGVLERSSPSIPAQ